jgi:Zn-finger domain-containing protein
MSIKIEKDIKIPKSKRNIKIEAIEKMQIGDSVFFETVQERQSFFNTLNYYKRNYDNNSLFCQRAVDGGYRFWRLK